MTRRAWFAGLVLAVAGSAAQSQTGRGFRDRPQTAADTAERFGRGLAAFSGFDGQAGGPRPLLFGFALECTKCQPMNRRGGFGAGPMSVWRYDEFPRIVAVVEESPAARAGIREGDLLVSVGGASLITDVGARAFSGLRAGDTASLTLERNGKAYNATLVLARGPGMRAGLGALGGRGAMRLNGPSRFSTRVGTTAIEIDSDAPVIATTDSSGTTTLRVGGTTIRLRPTTSKNP